VHVSLLATGLWSVQSGLVAAGLLGAEHIPHPCREETLNPVILTYRTKDYRHIALAMIHGDRYWGPLCEAFARPGLVEDPRFSDRFCRTENAPECVAVLDDVFAQRTLDEWCEILATQPGPWDVVQTPGEVLRDPQVLANGLVQEVDYGGGRTIQLVSSPVQFDGAPPTLRPAPDVGAHTEEVLLEHGKSWDEIVELKELGAIT
jgi:crotonobetainyl-CoA:carnitine CoA-transferase CaiB-like acyl-CoA transferase